jgi:hypothetical protein
LATALIDRSVALVDFNQWNSGLECARRALDLARRINSPRRIAEALNAVAYAHKSPTETQDYVLEALATFRQLQDSFSASLSLIFLSISLGETQEDIRRARSLNEEAMELAEEIGSTYHRLMLWSNEGMFDFLLGEVDSAVLQSRRAMRLSRRRGSPVGVDCYLLLTLSCCATPQGRFLDGAQLEGALQGMEERAMNEVFMTPLDLRARDTNRVLMREALGDDGYERAISRGKGLSLDRVYELALGHESPVE